MRWRHIGQPTTSLRKGGSDHPLLVYRRWDDLGACCFKGAAGHQVARLLHHHSVSWINQELGTEFECLLCPLHYQYLVGRASQAARSHQVALDFLSE